MTDSKGNRIILPMEQGNSNSQSNIEGGNNPQIGGNVTGNLTFGPGGDQNQGNERNTQEKNFGGNNTQIQLILRGDNNDGVNMGNKGNTQHGEGGNDPQVQASGDGKIKDTVEQEGYDGTKVTSGTQGSVREIAADNAEDVVIDCSLLRSMEEKLASTDGPESSPSFTICRVPAIIRECDHAAYNPQIVSIGPFHRGRKNLQAMEEHKWRYLDAVLAYGRDRNNLKKFLKKMKEIEPQARNCYSESIKMRSDEFVEMMVLDGCFIIFLILRQMGLVKTHGFIYDNCWMPSPIHLDMILLENQLPFVVLDCLWELIGQQKATLRTVVLASCEVFFSCKLKQQSPEEDVNHLLHLLHLSLKPDSPTPATRASGSSLRLRQHTGEILRFLYPTYLINTCDRFLTPRQQSSQESQHQSQQLSNMIPSAMELQEAGVRFQLKEARSFFEVGFEQGLMEMPRLRIYDETGILFRNFIAFEQCFPNWGNHFTSYCSFIDFLVNTPRDVSILREADVIGNWLGSDEEVALLFNKLCKKIFWNSKHSYLADLFQRVNRHTQKRWPKWRAKLVRDYFGSPWAIVSLIAAVIILILTFLQTYFSIFAYFNPAKP